MAQANFIKGGLLLGMAFDHAFTDGAGSISAIKIWAAYCRGDDDARAIAAHSLDRTRLIEGTRAFTLDDVPESTDVAAKPCSSCQRLSRVFQVFKTWITYLLHSPTILGWGTIAKLAYFTQARQQATSCTEDMNLLAREVFLPPSAKLNELKHLAAEGEANTKRSGYRLDLNQRRSSLHAKVLHNHRYAEEGTILIPCYRESYCSRAKAVVRDGT